MVKGRLAFWELLASPGHDIALPNLKLIFTKQTPGVPVSCHPNTEQTHEAGTEWPKVTRLTKAKV